MYVHYARTVLPDSCSCQAIGLLVPKCAHGLTPSSHADQVPVMKDQSLNILAVFTEKSCFRGETVIFSSGLLIVGV